MIIAGCQVVLYTTSHFWAAAKRIAIVPQGLIIDKSAPLDRQTMLVRQVILLLTALVLSACEPIGPLPGTSLAGEVAAPPSDWTLLDGADVVQLQTTGPRSVNIWGVGLASGYYVAASQGNKATWANRIEQDAMVRLRVDGVLYDLHAQVVTDIAEIKLVAEAFKVKYKLDAEQDFPEATVFRLDPR
jgi:hypothetical protein